MALRQVRDHDLRGTTPSVRPFDAGALHLALDARRTARGLSWKGLADQIWAMSSDLNDRRRDHPISPSTLTGMAKRPGTSCQHALFMLRWLLVLLYATMDEERRQQGLTWPALAGVLGCSPNQLTALRTAKFATGMD